MKRAPLLNFEPVVFKGTNILTRLLFPAPGGWGNNWESQGTQDYAYFESGFATGGRQPSRQQRDTAPRPFRGIRRHRRIRGPTRDQKIQIFFNITGVEMSFCRAGNLNVFGGYAHFTFLLFLPLSQQTSLCRIRGTTRWRWPIRRGFCGRWSS